MNITQYRALKAQEATQPATPVEQTQPIVETKPIETPVVETKPVEVVTPSLPEKVLVNGAEVTIDELKNGYLRQIDYTQKTQDVARQRKEAEEALKLVEEIKKNPTLAQQVSQSTQASPSLDPVTERILQLQDMVYDMKLEKEIDSLQRKYPDFEVKEVIDMAKLKNMTNLEDAYLLVKSNKQTAQPAVNEAEIEAKLRAKILAEIQAERTATQTIITSGGTSVITNNEPKMSDAEKKVAKMMKLTDADYVKWRDAGVNKK